MRKIAVLAAILLAAVIALPLWAKGAQESKAAAGPVKLQMSWWGAKERHDATLAAIEIWNKANPNIQVEPYFSGWTGYHEKLATQFAGHNPPDVIQYSTAVTQEYGSKDLLLDLKPFMDKYFFAIDKGLQGFFFYKDKVVGISAGANGAGLLFNKTKLDAMGLKYPTDDETWDTLFERLKAVTRDTNKDGKIDQWGIPNPMLGDISWTRHLVRQFGVDIFTDDLKKSNYGNPKFVNALKSVYDRYWQAGVCPPPDAYTLKEGQGDVDAGYCVFALIPLSTFMGRQALTKDKLGMVMQPRQAGGIEARILDGGMPFGITTDSKYREQALKFISWFVSAPEPAKVLGMVRGIFAAETQRKALLETIAVDAPDREVFRIASQIGALGVPSTWAWPPAWPEAMKITNAEMDKYRYGRITIEEMCRNIAAQIDPMFAQ